MIRRLIIYTDWPGLSEEDITPEPESEVLEGTIVSREVAVAEPVEDKPAEPVDTPRSFELLELDVASSFEALEREGIEALEVADAIKYSGHGRLPNERAKMHIVVQMLFDQYDTLPVRVIDHYLEVAGLSTDKNIKARVRREMGLYAFGVYNSGGGVSYGVWSSFPKPRKLPRQQAVGNGQAAIPGTLPLAQTPWPEA